MPGMNTTKLMSANHKGCTYYVFAGLCLLLACLHDGFADESTTPKAQRTTNEPYSPYLKTQQSIEAIRMAREILFTIYEHRHQSVYDALSNWSLGNLDDFKSYHNLSPTKAEAAKNWSAAEWQSERDLFVENSINNIRFAQHNQTVAVAIDSIDVVVALFIYTNELQWEPSHRDNNAAYPTVKSSKGLFRKEKELFEPEEGTRRILDAFIKCGRLSEKNQGVLPDDYKSIEDIITKNPALKSYGIMILLPNMDEIENLAPREREYQAEMQIKEYYKSIAGSELASHDVTIQTSKPSCKPCFGKLDDKYYKYSGKPYGKTHSVNSAEHLKRSIAVHRLKTGNVPNGKSITPAFLNKEILAANKVSAVKNNSGLSRLPGERNEDYKKKIEILESCGGSCKGTRRKRSICSRLQDFTEIDADKMQAKISNMGNEDKRRLFSALEEIGLQKLKGSEESIKKIKHQRKGWKTQMVPMVHEMIERGTLTTKLMLGDADSIDALKKSLISPKLFAESIAFSRNSTETTGGDLDITPQRKESQKDIESPEKTSSISSNKHASDDTTKQISPELRANTVANSKKSTERVGDLDVTPQTRKKVKSPAKASSISSGTQSSEKTRHQKSEISGTLNKVVNGINLAMVGKNLVVGVIQGDILSVTKMAGRLGGGFAAGKVGDWVVEKGKDMASKGRNLIGNSFKVAGPLIGSATLYMDVYNFFTQMSSLTDVKGECKRKDVLFQQKFDEDCKIDTDIAFAKVLEEGANVVLGVASTVTAILTSLSLTTGPVGIIIAIGEVGFEFAVQLYTSIQTVGKIENSIEGGLRTEEKLSTGFLAFFGMGPPQHIQKLLNKKAYFNQAVEAAVGFLEHHPQFDIYVGPTIRSKEVNCTTNYPTSWTRSILGKLPKGEFLYDKVFSRKAEQVCNTIQEFEPNSEADFRHRRLVQEFRVNPDRPSSANLICNPIKNLNVGKASDPEHGRKTNSYLCRNTIAVGRKILKGLGAFMDYRDGNDLVYGFPHYKNLFLVDSGRKEFTGGNLQDTFVLKTFPITGILNGNGGVNIIYIPEDLQKHAKTNVKIVLGSSSFKNIQQVVGRQRLPEVVQADCDTSFVNLQGGNNVQSDQIDVPRRDYCNYRLLITLQSHTKVANQQAAGGSQFRYEVEFGPNIAASFHMRDDTSHQFEFKNMLSAKLRVERGQIKIEDANGNSFISTYSSGAKNLTLATDEGLFIKCDPETNTFYGISVISSQSRKSEISGLLYHPNHFVIRDGATAFTISGGSQQDVFLLQGTSRGVLYGGAGIDSLVIDDETTLPNQPLSVDFTTSEIKHEGSILWKFFQINNFFGRTVIAETILVSCGLEWLDARGGSEQAYDRIDIPPDYCSLQDLHQTTTLTIQMHPYTSVTNSATRGEFVYHLTLDTNPTLTEVDTSKSLATHHFVIPANLEEIHRVDFDVSSGLIQIHFQNNLTWKTKLHCDSLRSDFLTLDKMKIVLDPEPTAIIESHRGTISGNYTGLQNYPNIFLLGGNITGVIWNGGKKADTFIVSSGSFQGEIDGNEGLNTLILGEGFYTEIPLMVDVGAGQIFLNSPQNVSGTTFRNIETVIGRKAETEAVIADCSTFLIDTMGSAYSSQPDFIGVPLQLNCAYKLKIALRPNLIVENQAAYGNFSYEGNIAFGNTTLILPFSDNLNHEVSLQFDFRSVDNMFTNNGHLYLKHDDAWFSVNYAITDDSEYQVQPKIVFADNLQLRISNYGESSFSVYGQFEFEGTKQTLRKRALDQHGWEQYKAAAKRLKTNMVIQVGETNVVSIGAGWIFDVITAVPGFDNKLIANGADQTVFRIAHGTGPVSIETAQNDVNQTSGDLGTKSSAFAIDLSPIVQNRIDLFPEIERSPDGIDFFLENTTVFIKKSKELMSGSHYQVLLRDVYLDLKCTNYNDNCSLEPKPIILNPEHHEMVMLAVHDMEPGTRIILVANSVELTLEPAKLEDTLVLSNLFQGAEDDTVSISIVDFYLPNVAEMLGNRNITISYTVGDTIVYLDSTIGRSAATFEKKAEMFESDTLSPVGLLFILFFFLTLLFLLCWIFCRQNRVVYDVNSQNGPTQNGECRSTILLASSGRVDELIELSRRSLQRSWEGVDQGL